MPGRAGPLSMRTSIQTTITSFVGGGGRRDDAGAAAAAAAAAPPAARKRPRPSGRDEPPTARQRTSSFPGGPALLLAHDPAHTYLNRGRELRRWHLVCDILRSPITTTQDLVDAMEGCNPDMDTRVWDMSGLIHYLERCLEPDRKTAFFSSVLPWMQRIALAAPDLLQDPIPLLRIGREGSVTLTELQTLCILTHCFFCIVPHRHSAKHRKRRMPAGDYDRAYMGSLGTYPDINFLPLYVPQNPNYSPGLEAGAGAAMNPVTAAQAAKLDCFFHYFAAQFQRFKGTVGCPAGVAESRVEVARVVRAAAEQPVWRAEGASLCEMEVMDGGTIEDDSDGMLQADFAHRMIGGGVVGRGCVQEEIRFCICPELILARVVSERMTRTESVVVCGARRFSRYTGYASSFRWAGPHRDKASMWAGVLSTAVVAMDAMDFRLYGGGSSQYDPQMVNRELGKAYAAFCGSDLVSLPQARPAKKAGTAVSTGKWGCGVFGGDAELKAVVQWLAASVAKRSRVRFFTYGDPSLAAALTKLSADLQRAGVAVPDLYDAVLSFSVERFGAAEAAEAADTLSRSASIVSADGADEVDAEEEAKLLGRRSSSGLFAYIRRKLLGSAVRQ
eukprot:TRINITY_DN1255_c0_g1_i1.p1 TRINITY_DN1255_c0_g1~~TRINITY_DN1255_c0_g1_i1.p1  ORF type:complete len:641 (+),score=184.26 TRINITY_DN1255_c0_g1_i1:81-1925(+)